MENDLYVRFLNFLVSRFPETKVKQSTIDELYEFWLDGYQNGAEDHQ